MACNKRRQTEVLEGNVEGVHLPLLQDRAPQKQPRKAPLQDPTGQEDALELGEESGFSSSLHSTPTHTPRVLGLEGP